MDGSGEKQKAQHDFHQDSSKIKRTGKLSGFFKQSWKKKNPPTRLSTKKPMQSTSPQWCRATSKTGN